MSDIEMVVKALQESGPSAAGTVAGLYAARRLLGGSLDAVGERLTDFTRARLDNLGSIFRKADALSGDADAYPHIRVVGRVINDATLYDDDVMQSYVAGLIAGSRNADGSDDRPVFYLSLFEGLTAVQLATFHVLSSAAVSVGSAGDPEDPARTRISVGADEVSNAVSAVRGEELDLGTEVLLALEHAGLITGLSTSQDSGAWRIAYRLTRVGALLFDWAHGLDDDDITGFFTRRRPAIDLPAVSFYSVKVE